MCCGLFDSAEEREAKQIARAQRKMEKHHERVVRKEMKHDAKDKKKRHQGKWTNMPPTPMRVEVALSTARNSTARNSTAHNSTAAGASSRASRASPVVVAVNPMTSYPFLTSLGDPTVAAPAAAAAGSPRRSTAASGAAAGSVAGSARRTAARSSSHTSASIRAELFAAGVAGQQQLEPPFLAHLPPNRRGHFHSSATSGYGSSASGERPMRGSGSIFSRHSEY